MYYLCIVDEKHLKKIKFFVKINIGKNKKFYKRVPHSHMY